jgi:hypothetical protein
VYGESHLFLLAAFAKSGSQRTQLLVLGHGLVVLAVELGPFSKVVLRRRVSKLALKLHNLLLEHLAAAC